MTRPIKGTSRRSAGGRLAAAQRGELEESAKNRAENVMIVDLMRNDLSRVCVPGSVEVPRLLDAEPHAGGMCIWCRRCAECLDPRSGNGDVSLGCFPTRVGDRAPKIRALEIIHELEAVPRRSTTGAMGYRSPAAGLELNVAIRTFEFCDGRVRSAPAAVVAGSVDSTTNSGSACSRRPRSSGPRAAPCPRRPAEDAITAG